ncbi:hypothetical protein RJ55_01646 [Drechmeria coniospora]|nr:hypothetical protein RJ55_01646 [Drechmeria coniospora]
MASSNTETSAHVGVPSLLDALQPANRHVFLQPSSAIPAESLRLVKDTLDAFATQVGEEQERILKESRKRKRSGENLSQAGDVLKLRKVYTDGFETDQVWQQAKKIIGCVLRFSEAALDDLQERQEVAAAADGSDDDESASRSLELGSELAGEEDSDEGDELGTAFSDEEEEGDDIEGENADQDDELELGEEEEEEEEEEEGEGDEEEEGDEQEYVEDPNGLNDGFFSIDDFNKQSQWFESQDAKGDPTTDQASDDEEIDWGADPMAPPKPGAKSKKSSAEDEPPEEEDEEDEEDGPTFGDMALDAPEGESEDESMDDVEDDAGDFNANEVYYKDFFAPPPRKGNGEKARRPAKVKKAEQPSEEDVERAMADVKRDLFDDESENEDSDDAQSDLSAGDPRSRRSAHERRQAKLAEEIRQLEAASVAKREWTLSGEAAAADRPMNSLLEEDLDFEHVGKPVPAPEVSEGIEELIKRRILAQEFDEVLRRRPDTEGVPAGTRRGMIELDDSKPSKGLAEVYEEEHVKNANPDSYVSQSDEKLQREEKEVESMWRAVCARLDALSSWHYKPKHVAPSLSVVADVATVAIEDAQPSTAQGVAGESSRMAPQEIYKAGAESTAKGEIVTRAGLPLARQELSREERTRRRRRHKERVRKAGGSTTPAAAANAAGSKAAAGKGSPRATSQRETMAELRKGGVKVINRKGEITDVDGNKAKATQAVSSGSYKL